MNKATPNEQKTLSQDLIGHLDWAITQVVSVGNNLNRIASQLNSQRGTISARRIERVLIAILEAVTDAEASPGTGAGEIGGEYGGSIREVQSRSAWSAGRGKPSYITCASALNRTDRIVSANRRVYRDEHSVRVTPGDHLNDQALAGQSDKDADPVRGL